MNELDDSEWLLARERGEDVSHVPAYTREKYSQLDRLIHDLPTCAPSPGWKQRVLDSLDDPLDDQLASGRPHNFPLATARSRIASPHRSPPPPPRRLPWALGSGIMSLAAVLALCVYVHEPRTPEGSQVALSSETNGAVDSRAPGGPFDDPTIESLWGAAEASPTAPLVSAPRVGVRRAARRYRGDAALNLGDTLVLEATAERPIELRVYGDAGEPLARCTETQGCGVRRIGAHRVYHLELQARAPGAMRTMVYDGGAMPELFASLDNDTEAAGRAGIRVRQLAVVHVE
jgi:hypothetical protein